VPANLRPSWTCEPLAKQISAISQSAGCHADVADLPQQIEAACEMGTWSLELRQCFAAATAE